jgi:hypothetical protein
MSVETLERPAGQAAESVDDTEIDMAEEVDEDFMEKAAAEMIAYIKSGIPTIHHAKVNKDGHIVIPADFPEEDMEAWDGENVRKV